jgi:Lon protease-like protein
MPAILEEMPLFPLDAVLFPYASLSLHVFEERYKEMIRMCLEFDRPFGIVLIRHGEELGAIADPYMVGTAVRIVKVHSYEDGAMDLHVQGERRFRIRELDESNPYLVGKVEPVVEVEVDDSAESNSMLFRAREEFELLVKRLFARQEFNVQVVFPSDPVALSFTMANLLPMENLQKQRLLETTDTLERVEFLIPILQHQNMEYSEPSYFRIGGNELREWITPN